jgi:hypothetical protein
LVIPFQYLTKIRANFHVLRKYQTRTLMAQHDTSLAINPKLGKRFSIIFPKSTFLNNFFYFRICWNIHNVESKNVLLCLMKIAHKGLSFSSICLPIPCSCCAMRSLYFKCSWYHELQYNMHLRQELGSEYY